METYRTEEEQVEAMRRWWDENGRSTIVAIVLALSAGFGWQAWKDYNQERTENASYVYQAMLESLNGSAADEKEFTEVIDLAEQLKSEYTGTSYAQFAALHLAKLAAKRNDLEEAKAQLQWVLGKAPAKSDIADIARLRLARVLASAGDTDQALAILAKGKGGAYAASYAIAQGDVYMQLDRPEDASNSYAEAKLALARSAVDGRIPTLDQKIQSLSPVPAREVEAEAAAVPTADAAVKIDDTGSAEPTENQES
ncbi:MAG: tetratricopeptide repeat protein [Proteobacteria bacterium]|nr:tetratricopeptide repeat protein [Pseudomonadota bacterium]